MTLALFPTVPKKIARGVSRYVHTAGELPLTNMAFYVEERNEGISDLIDSQERAAIELQDEKVRPGSIMRPGLFTYHALNLTHEIPPLEVEIYKDYLAQTETGDEEYDKRFTDMMTSSNGFLIEEIVRHTTAFPHMFVPLTIYSLAESQFQKDLASGGTSLQELEAAGRLAESEADERLARFCHDMSQADMIERILRSGPQGAAGITIDT